MAGDVRNALVTGGAGGIGRAIAAALAEAGHRVAIADVDGAAADRTAAEIGPLATPIALDVTDTASVDALPDSLPAAFRPIDILVSNAGHDIGGRTRFDRGTAGEWASILETNLLGAMRVTRALVPDMVARDRGDVVMITSISAIRMVPDMAAYTASKAGLRAFTDILRADLAETGIRVTEILPGLTKTGIILKRHRGDAEAEREYFERFRIALAPEDVARCVMFALSQPSHMQIAQMFVLPVNRW